jgi:hypothetical protein
MVRRTVSAPNPSQYFEEVRAELALPQDTIQWHGRISLAADRLGPLSVFTTLEDIRAGDRTNTRVTAELATFYEDDMMGAQITDVRNVWDEPVVLGVVADDLWVVGDESPGTTRLHHPPQDVDPAMFGLGATVSEQGYAIGQMNLETDETTSLVGPAVPYDAYKFISGALERIGQLPPDRAVRGPLEAPDADVLSIFSGRRPGPGPGVA